MDSIWILAQGPAVEGSKGVDSEPAGTEEITGTKEGTGDPNMSGRGGRGRGFLDNPTSLIFLVLMFVMFYLILFRGPRKKQQQHRQMVQTLERNDRVRTIGGIIGVVVDIKGDEITLKVDESNNTKIKVISSAIGKNLSKDK
ncbi:MAG: preprotein translocase subunit YajC [Planctomycetota bacterium]|jgi:preprotein translocase subunit YajC